MSRPVDPSRAAAAALAELATHPVDAVVLGGSAGALEGLMRILPALPAGFAAPVRPSCHICTKLSTTALIIVTLAIGEPGRRWPALVT